MSKLSSDQYVRNNIEHCINELIGIVKHTESFEDEPEKKKRQLARNESMRLASIKRLEDLVEEQKREYGLIRYKEGRDSVGEIYQKSIALQKK